MPSAEGKQHKGAGERKPDDGSVACELRPFAHPVSDALVLAAIERAERHKPRSSPGVMLGDVFAHMGFLYNGAEARGLTRICGSASPNVSRPRPRTSGRRFIA